MNSRRVLILLVLLLVVASGLGAYVFRLMRRARAAALVSAAYTRPVAPPVAGPTTKIALFAANDDDAMLHSQEASIALPPEPAKRAREILRALLAQYQEQGSAHPLGAQADINDVYLVGGNLAVVDVNAAFCDSHPSGILAEQLTLASMVQTLAANIPGLTRVKVLVDGKERATLAGHAGLSDPYTVEEAASIVQPSRPGGRPPARPAGDTQGVQARLLSR
jgi:hypothetical protein